MNSKIINQRADGIAFNVSNALQLPNLDTVVQSPYIYYPHRYGPPQAQQVSLAEIT